MSRDVLFKTLVEGLMPEVYAFAYWLSGDKHQAEDLTQDSLLRAWRFVDRLRDQKAIKPWLFTIVRREFYRSKSNKVQQAEVDLEEPQQFFDTQLGEVDVIDAERLEVQQAIGELPPQYREPLVLQVLMGHSTEEIAAIMNIKQGAVLTRLFRARKQIREWLDKQREQETTAKVVPFKR